MRDKISKTEGSIFGCSKAFLLSFLQSQTTVEDKFPIASEKCNLRAIIFSHSSYLFRKLGQDNLMMKIENCV